MTVIVINKFPPEWALNGEPRPPEWMRKYFPDAWEREFIIYGDPVEVGKYFAEETMKQIRQKYNLGGE
jgi:hypothetical protein